ncbi:hypothetical protein [Colwellia piezophila]|uniref:hypothetical protein n=1 Tax=Colwellia piezophila TaxID=211668 RepID=UPI003CCC1ED9
MVALLSSPKEDILQVVDELLNPEIKGDYVKRFRVLWAKWQAKIEIQTNLDGEPIKENDIFYQVMPQAINLVLPEHFPVLII